MKLSYFVFTSKCYNLHYEKFADGTVKEIEVPYELPEGWEWVRLPSLVKLENGAIRRGPFGSAITKSMFVPYSKDVAKVYEQGNAIRKTIDYGNYYLSKEDFQRLESFEVRTNDIIVSCAGTIGRTFLIPDSAPKGVINQALLRLRINENVIDSQYFLHAFQNQVEKINNDAAGTAIKNLGSVKYLRSDLIWSVPPIQEQKRIIKRINFLFNMIETIAEEQKSLQQLSIQLKQKVLDTAMQGKLVPQDPNDEPASVLLEKIRAEKQRLYEEGKIKKKDLEEITVEADEDNAYYGKIPDGWEITAFKNIVNYRMGKTPDTKNNIYWDNGKISWISIADINDNRYIHDTKKKITFEAFSEVFNNQISPVDTLVMSFKLTIGKVGILKQNMVHNEAIISIYPYSDINNSLRNYLYYILPIVSNRGETISAIKGKTLNSKKINELLIPLPPVKEQILISQTLDCFYEILDFLF